MELDQRNGSMKWQYGEKIELNQVDIFEPYLTTSIYIQVHMEYDIKHDLRQKALLVADGCLTETPIDHVYLIDVSLKG